MNYVNPRLAASIAALLAVTALAGCATAGQVTNGAQASVAADLALRNGAIYTVNGARGWAESIAIDDGRIVYIGNDAGAKGYIGPQTQVVDLKGRMVLPGIQDVHIHPILGGIEANGCDLNAGSTVDEYIAIIRKYAEKHPDQPWIKGGGWSMAAFGPGALARKELIDAVVSDRPVVLMSRDGHTTWVNSRALEVAGITRDTPDPADGRIDRDPNTGEPSGSLQEGAGDLVAGKAPPDTDAVRDAGLRYAVRMLNAYGITGIQDASVYEEDLKTYHRLDAAGELSLHVVGAIWWARESGLEQIEAIKKLRSSYTRGRVDASTVKIMQDGVLENYTGVVLEPYRLKGQQDVHGIPMIEPQLLQQAVTMLDAEGFQVHFHAIGDGAVRQALDAVEAARSANGELGRRHHISHLQLIHPEDQPRFRRLNVIANFQPLWAYADDYVTELTLPFISERAASYMYPIGSMERGGATVAFGSDWSVSTANPFEQIETAVTRMGSLGDTDTPFMPEERIGLPEALAAFTINAAFANRDEQHTGSLEVGKLANLAVLDRNLFDIPATEISETRVLLTLFEGKPVHGRPDEL